MPRVAVQLGVLLSLLLVLGAYAGASDSALAWQEELDSFSTTDHLDAPHESEDDLGLEDESPLVCLVVRTFWGHGEHGEDSLRTLLAALQAQNFTRWEAVLLILDERPFPELRRIVREFEDDRIWVFAEWVHESYAPKQKFADGRVGWAPGYHNMLYNLTDRAIRACPPSTEWVVATNGDNTYDVHFLDHLMAAPDDAHAVAFDYYSRYQRITAPPCDRFAAEPAKPQCKQNGMDFCQTDLAATAYYWPLLVAQNWLLGLADPDGATDGGNDGLMARQIVQAGWKVHRVTRCLVDHGPSPQQCALRGGVWDDSRFAVHGFFGGGCLDRSEAADVIKHDPAGLEIVKVNVSYDPYSFGLEDMEGDPMPLACIRYSDRTSWTQQLVFGHACAARQDSIDEPPLPQEVQQEQVGHSQSGETEVMGEEKYWKRYWSDEEVREGGHATNSVKAALVDEAAHYNE